MMSDDDPATISPEALAKLPLRALVGFAVRCARRVQPFYDPWIDPAEKVKNASTLDSLLREAEAFVSDASGESGISDGYAVCTSIIETAVASRARATTGADRARADASSLVAGAIRDAAHAASLSITSFQECDHHDAGAVIILAEFASNYAIAAYDAISKDQFEIVRATVRDYRRLRILNLGTFPAESGPVILGCPVDLSESGPLGPLWAGDAA